VAVVTIGHALVDVLASVDDALVTSFGLAKGTMTLVSDLQSERIYEALGTGTTVSGGSAANTAAGLTSFGTSAAFVGKVRNDALGDVFCDDIRAAGVQYRVPPATTGPGTGRSMIMVTADAERTMCTSLGAGDFVNPEDLDEAAVTAARVVYIEGYLCGLETTDATVERALDLAHAAGALVSLSLSDPLWVELHGDSLSRLLSGVDILFCNEAEARGITGLSDATRAVNALADRCRTVAVTFGPRGSVVVSDGHAAAVAANAVPQVVDTTGAGDLYAAGFLYGVVEGLDAERSGRLGSIAAAEVISHFGARPLRPLSELVCQADLAG
jgi:sugar/nucleoside kinase (ribokinase family)